MESSSETGETSRQQSSVPKPGRSNNRTSVTWRVASDLSAAHAAHVVATDGPCIDVKLEALLVDDVTQINTRLVSESIDVSRFWSHYLHQIAAQRTIEFACTDALASASENQWNLDQTSKAISRRLINARDVFARKFPRVEDQLELRGQPLRARWDTFGIGLLQQVDQLIWQGGSSKNWWPPRVEGLLVQPVSGGAGSHDCDGKRFWMEAVLTDIDPTVSEVLRIAFLITSIAIDGYTKSVTENTRIQNLWSFASVPIVLEAAAELEMIRSERLPVAEAMRLWDLGTTEIAERVSVWWPLNSPSKEPLAMTIPRLAEKLNE